MPAPDHPEAPPKLTAGQRLLLLLPRLQRQQQGASAGGAHPGAAAAAKGAAKPGAATGPKRTGTAPKPAAGGRQASGTTGSPPVKATSPSPGPATGSSANGAAQPKAAVRTSAAAANGRSAPAPGGVEPAAARPTFGARMRDGMLKPKPQPTAGPSGKAPTKSDPYPDKSSAELKHWMKYLDDQERLFTLIAAPLATILGITSLVVSLRDNPAVGHKGHVAPEEIIILGAVVIALSVVVLVSALLRRRSFAVFALFFVGFGLETGLSVLGVIPFWGLGGWMFWRSSRMQRALTTRGDHPRQQARRGSQSRGSARSAPSGGRRKKKEPEPKGPARNKRYTPPKPKDDDDR